MLKKSLEIITGWLEKQQVPYMVFGGIANTLYGNPRQTFDIDIKISLPSNREINNFIDAIQSIATVLTENPLEFIAKTNVLPITVKRVRVDLVFARLPFEVEAINRSELKQAFGAAIHVCRVEDFILQKVISTRQKDWDDIATVIRLQKETIDWNYLLKHCNELSMFLSDSEILNKIERMR